MFQRGVSPVRLSQLDVRPAVEAAQMVAAAKANLNSSIGQSVLKFQEKQQEKKQKEMTVNALKSFAPGLNEDMYKAAANDDSVKDSLMLFGREQAKAAAELELAKLQAQQPPKLSAQEEKIQIFQDTFNLSRQDAVDLAQGTKRFITDPITKKSAIVNIRTNEVTPVDVPQEAQDTIVSDTTLPTEDSASSINLYQMAETTTGLVPLLSAKAQGITGQLGVDVADEELLENIQTFKTAQQDIIRSLRASPKILATEMNRLAQELDISPGAFKDVKTLRSQLRSIDKSINSRVENIERLIADPNASAEDVRGARSLRNDLINFKRILGVPVDNEVFQGTSTQDLSNIGNIANKYLNQ
jgi:hypothetical protein